MFSPANTGTYGFSAPKGLIVSSAAACAAVFILTASASAAPISAVIAACDRTPGCDYSIDGGGGLTGCSPNTCFTCSPKTKQCIAVRSGSKPSVKGPSLVNSVLGNSARPTGSAKPVGSIRPAAGAPITAGNASAGDRPGSIKPLTNTSTPKINGGVSIKRETSAANAGNPDSGRRGRDR